MKTLGQWINLWGGESFFNFLKLSKKYLVQAVQKNWVRKINSHSRGQIVFPGISVSRGTSKMWLVEIFRILGIFRPLEGYTGKKISTDYFNHQLVIGFPSRYGCLKKCWRFFLIFKRRYLDTRTSKHSIPHNFLKQFFEFFLVVPIIILFRDF